MTGGWPMLLGMAFRVAALVTLGLIIYELSASLRYNGLVLRRLRLVFLALVAFGLWFTVGPLDEIIDWWPGVDVRAWMLRHGWVAWAALCAACALLLSAIRGPARNGRPGAGP